jgi:hypothetical protein
MWTEFPIEFERFVEREPFDKDFEWSEAEFEFERLGWSIGLTTFI